MVGFGVCALALVRMALANGAVEVETSEGVQDAWSDIEERVTCNRVSAAVNNDVLSGLWGIEGFSAGFSYNYTYYEYYYIGDGGEDMYDDGNYINPRLPYRDSCSEGIAEDGSVYYMDIVSDGVSVTYFPSAPPTINITGETGADGSGNMTTGSYSSGGWHAFWKQILEGEGDPGINHLWITNSSSANHSVPDPDTDNDLDVLSGVSGAPVFYLHWGRAVVVDPDCDGDADEYEVEVVAVCPSGCRSSRTGKGRSLHGTGIYTRDSDICGAAIHAGAITDAGGHVRVEWLTYSGNYTGSESNNMTSEDWNEPYEDAFEVFEHTGPLPSGYTSDSDYRTIVDAFVASFEVTSTDTTTGTLSSTSETSSIAGTTIPSVAVTNSPGGVSDQGGPNEQESSSGRRTAFLLAMPTLLPVVLAMRAEIR